MGRLLHLALLSYLALESTAFNFLFPQITGQCGTSRVSWQGGQAPYRIMLAAMNDYCFTYTIDDPAYYNNNTKFWSYDLQLQRPVNTSYVLFMSDATGIGTGGSDYLVNVDHVADVGCFANLDRNITTLGPILTVRPSEVAQCQSGFQMTWLEGYAPFNMTVISLDSSFDPYDVILGNGNSWNWTPNLRAGSEFMVMMNDGLGYGRGGAVGPYTVAASGDSSCLTGGTVTPGVYHTRTTGAATSTSRQTGSGDAGSLSSGAIGGLVAGIVVALIILLTLVWYIRRRRVTRHAASNRSVDLLPFIDTDDKDTGPGQHAGTMTRSTEYLPLRDDGVARAMPHHRLSVETDVQSTRIDPFLGDDTPTDSLYPRMHVLQEQEEHHDERSDWGEGSEDDMSVVPNVAMSDAGRTEPPTPTEPKLRSTLTLPSPYPTDRKRHASPRPPPPASIAQSPARNTIHTGRTMFVRHQDAGMLRSGVDEVIDLPPLYTDVARAVPPRGDE